MFSIKRGFRWMWALLVWSVIGIPVAAQAPSSWAQRIPDVYTVAQLLVDAHGDVYAVVNAHNNVVVAKYSATGEVRWMHHFATTSIEAPTAAALDPQGNLCVTGYTKRYGTGLDYLTIKYNPDGIKLWHRRYNGFGVGNDVAVAIVADSQGDFFVTGVSKGNTKGDNIVTIRYSPAGQQMWVRRFFGTDSVVDAPGAIALDPGGHVVVIGRSMRSKVLPVEWVTVKYDADGNTLWHTRYHGPDDADRGSEAAFLAVDSRGYIYVGGDTQSGTTLQWVVVKYTPDGHKVRAKTMPFGWMADMRLDAADNLYVAGSHAKLGGVIRLIKYTPGGEQVYDAYQPRTTGPAEFPRNLYVDPRGVAYVIGSVDRPDSGVAVLAYGPDGTFLHRDAWSTNDPNGSRAFITGDGQGNVYFSALSDPTTTGYYDLITVRYPYTY